MSNENEVIERFPARVLTDNRDVPALQVGNETVNLTNADRCLEIIRQHAADPAIFDERAPYIWAAMISSNRRDYYATIMDPATTLRNYVEDAVAGVAFLDSHDSFQQPCGRSFAAAMVETEGAVNVYAAFYTIPDLKNQRINTTDLIDSIRSGITKDVSVGFKRGDNFEMRCSICGGNMMRWDECDHIQGIRYETYDDASGEWVQRTAVGIIIDARLSEVSAVYDGASPDCMIEKAKDLASRGLIKQVQRAAIEQQFRMVLPTRDSVAVTEPEPKKVPDAGASNSTKGERHMEEQKFDANPFTEYLRSIGALDATAAVSTQAEALSHITREVSRLRGIEAQHKEYRDAEVADAIQQGVRAQGDKFDKARYDGILNRATLTEIRSFRKEWQDSADAELGGGRRSTETGDDTDGTTDTSDENRQHEEETRRAKALQPESLMLPESLYR
jgi:hypothetical protein